MGGPFLREYAEMPMLTNVGLIDRTLRLLVGFGLLGWVWHYYGPPLHGWVDWAVTIIGGYPALTGLLRYDPIFELAGISTCDEEN